MFTHNNIIIINTGPFFITTDFDSGNNKTIYFKVEDCNVNVHATTEKSEASQFYVRYEQDNHFFRVNRYKTNSITTTGGKNNFVTQSSGSSMAEWYDLNLHLSAVVPRHGSSNRNRPLQVEDRDTSSQSYGYLAICKQKSQSVNSEAVELVTPERWFQEPGNEAFYIRCSAKPDATSDNCSYLCVRRKVRYYGRQTTYSTGSVPSIKDHNKSLGRSMLFKLVRASESDPREQLAESEML
ncbi:MAG: hypothetical protein MJE68_29820 [Proteobacteria bacterium]|nr:hypothetical protein [Pseudomonadota bacterium]